MVREFVSLLSSTASIYTLSAAPRQNIARIYEFQGGVPLGYIICKP